MPRHTHSLASGFGFGAVARRSMALGALLLASAAVVAGTELPAHAVNRSFPTGRGWTNPAGSATFEDWGFASCSPPYNDGKAHLGADSQGTHAGQDLYAMDSGTVRTTSSGWPGEVLGIEHVTGSGQRFIAAYAHIETSLGVGDTVAKGQTIGTILDQGANSHLHLGVRPLAPDEAGASVPLRGSSTCPSPSPAATYGWVDPLPWLAGRASYDDTTLDHNVDVMLTIDTTGSMSDDIDQVKAETTALVDTLAASGANWRIGLVTYRDLPPHGDPGDYAARLDLPFSDDTAAVKDAIAAIAVAGGGDTPETVLSGIQLAVDQPWRDGAKKAVIVLGDAPPHDPEPESGLASSDVIAAALAVDPAEIYPVLVNPYPELTAVMEPLAEGTGGRVVTSDGTDDVVASLGEVLTDVSSAPIAWAGGPYAGTVGETISVSASASFDPDGSIVSYEWDFDGDGTYDETTDSPQVEHVYTSPFDGQLSVRVTDDDGLQTVAMATVTITEPVEPPDPDPADEDPGPDAESDAPPEGDSKASAPTSEGTGGASTEGTTTTVPDPGPAPATTVGTGPLALTGSSVGPLVVTGLALVGAGVLTAAVAVRRRRTSA
jgi:PKD domain/Peptidase family M23/von Willebrand factor type A domain